jgi:hypothetical protein
MVAGTYRFEAIITRDARDFQLSPLRILSPIDLMNLLSPAADPPNTEKEIDRESSS